MAHTTASTAVAMKLKDKRFFIFEATMALAAVVTAAITSVALYGLPHSPRGFAEVAILAAGGILLHTACGTITWSTAKSDKYLELAITQVAYTSLMPPAATCLYVIFTALGGSNALSDLFTALLFAWLTFVLPSGIAVMLCCALYKVLAGRYAR